MFPGAETTDGFELGAMQTPEEFFGHSPPNPEGTEEQPGDEPGDDTPAEGTEEPAEDKPDDGPAQAFRIGNEAVPREQIEELWGNRELVADGRMYAQAMERYNSGPDGAAEVIASFIDAARETYKGEFVMSELPVELNDEDLTDVERALKAQNSRVERQLQILRSEYAATLAELRDATAQKLVKDAAPGWVAAVKLQYPDADASPDQLATWMREFSTKDPLVAYRAGTYDQRRDGSKPTDAAKGAAPAKEKPAMPRANSVERYFDPTDPRYSLRDFERMLADGMKADPNAKRKQ